MSLITPSCFLFFPTSMSAQSKSSPSRFAEKMARIKIPGLRRSRTSMISDDNSESSSLKTSSSSSVPEENSVGYPSTKSTSSLNTPGRSSPDRPRIQRPNSELISPSHLANLVTPPTSISSAVTVLTLFTKGKSWSPDQIIISSSFSIRPTPSFRPRKPMDSPECPLGLWAGWIDRASLRRDDHSPSSPGGLPSYAVAS